MHKVLIQTERRVRRIRPRQVIALEGGGAARVQPGTIAENDLLPVARFVRVELRPTAFTHGLRTAAVVRKKQYQRVVVLAQPLQCLQHTPYLLVHAVHLRGVHGHALRFPGLVGRSVPSWRVRVARGQRPLVLQHTAMQQFFVTSAAQLVPATCVFAGITFDIFWQCMQRPVRRVVRQIHEERLVGLRVLFQHADGGIGDGIGQVEVIGNLGGLVIVLNVPRREVVHDTIDHAVEAVEPTLQRGRAVAVSEAPSGNAGGPEVAAHVPLAGHQGAVAAALQHLGDSRGIFA